MKESENRDKYLDLAREKETSVEYDSDGDTNCDWYAWYSHQRISTGTGGLGNKRTSGDHQTTALLRSPRILIKVLET